MKRLIDEECAPGSPESLLAELVRATPPLAPASFERRRVFAHVTGSGHRARRLSVRAGAAVLLLGSVAAATIEHSWTAAHVVPPPVVAAAAAPSPVAVPSAVAEGVPPSPVGTPATPVIPRASGEAPSARLKTTARVANPYGEDPAPVLEAIRALRSEGDAARAGTLLAAYLKAHPQSVLSEDALALSIESAVARHDVHAASEFRRRYLAQYPNGRYRAFALRAIAP